MTEILLHLLRTFAIVGGVMGTAFAIFWKPEVFGWCLFACVIVFGGAALLHFVWVWTV
jgi:hypothetical protein